MSSKQDRRLQAGIWAEDPTQLNEVLREFDRRLKDSGSEQRAGRRCVFRYTIAETQNVLAPVLHLTGAVNEYRRLSSETVLDCRLLLEVCEQLQAESDTEPFVDIACELIHELQLNLSSFSRWCGFQERQSHTVLRSDVLGAEIEVEGDELIIRTDLDGSTRLRGTVAVPMFLAFWRARGHRLSNQSFEDVDRSINRRSLERYRTRLCARLQQVLLEVVPIENGFILQRSK